jgi:geranylgeranyl reductase family protein
VSAGVARYDVLVIGAGPGGSASAILLARAGARVALVERATFPRPKACAEYLSPEAGRVLARLGALSAVEAERPARLAGMRVVSPDGTSFAGRFSGARAFRPFAEHGLALPRERLDHVLADAAARAGATLLERTCLEGLERAPSGDVLIALRSAGGRRWLRAPLVIGADGLRSRVARWLGVARQGGRRRLALVAHVAGARGVDDLGEVHVAPGAYVGLAAVGHGLTNVAVVADLAAWPPGDRDERWHAVLRRFPTVADRLALSTRVSPVRAVGPFARWTTRATGDGALLVGDAADFYDPFTGEGIYAALRGAELAAARARTALEAGRFARRRLSGYDRDRRRVFGGKWLLERAIGVAVATPRLLDHVARRLARRQDLADLLIGATGDFVPLRRLLNPAVALRLLW